MAGRLEVRRMGEEIVEIAIGPDGRVVVEVQGMAGTGCLDETEDLVGLLGGEVESQELTAEAYVEQEQPQATHDRQARGRP
jgi:hypothetical protein